MHNNSRSILHGCGVFSTIRVMNGEPFLWEKHWRRLLNNAKTVGVNLAKFREDDIRQQLKEVITTEGISDGRARITFTDNSSSELWPSGDEEQTGLSFLIGALRLKPDNFRLTVSPYCVNSKSPLAGIKSCNYLEKILASDEAKARRFDEAVQVNERGEMTSATMANVFWLKDNVLYTPSLKTGCLPGTTREFVMENLDCREVEATIDELNSADAIFLTSAGLGVVQVAEFESRRFERHRTSDS